MGDADLVAHRHAGERAEGALKHLFGWLDEGWGVSVVRVGIGGSQASASARQGRKAGPNPTTNIHTQMLTHSLSFFASPLPEHTHTQPTARGLEMSRKSTDWGRNLTKVALGRETFLTWRKPPTGVFGGMEGGVKRCVWVCGRVVWYRGDYGVRV